MSNAQKIKQIVEGLLLAAGKPLTLERIAGIFNENERPENSALKAALQSIEEDCKERGFELNKVASGYRFQVKQELSDWITRLWEERPKKYSRALLETLAIIAYRQPITRGDIEKIRGVAVSSSIIRTLLDREWVRVVGYRDVPGRPAMYASTRQFLDYFNLESLEQLPALTEIRDLDELEKELPLEEVPQGRLIEYPEELEDDEVVVMDEEEAAAAAIGTRSLNEILGIVEESEDGEEEKAAEGSQEPESISNEIESAKEAE